MEVIAAVGGALVSASIDALFEKLRSSELLRFIPEEKLVAEIKKWETSLKGIDALLVDAEGRETEASVKVWLDQLRDLAYDIEDVLDEFSTRALKRQVTKENSHVNFLITGLSPASFSFKRKMASKMKGITARLQEIANQDQTLNLTRIPRERPNKSKERPPTSSLVEELDICGRKEDKGALVQMLLSHEGSSNPFSVIRILGMGGIGKTTLAQLVYNEYNVNAYFDIKVWVYVSENFYVEMLTRTILQSITRKTHEHLNFNLLQEELKEKLSQKKFLLILDDVWEEDYSQWENLCKPFFGGAAGSKIVITARKDGVASRARDVRTYRLEALLDDECLSLLARHALGAENFDSHLNLKDIAMDMVKKCRGLPLAAKVLGGLLYNKPSLQEWESVLRSELWSLPEKSNGTPLPVLKLSYNDLPSYLKRCFVYCGIFPKGYVFDRDELVLLWMAEGFLQLPQGNRMEDTGMNYFKDLLSRSLFQSFPGNPRLCVMHDFFNDLARSIGGEIYYNCEKKIVGSMSNSKSEKVRYASIRFPKDDDLQECTVVTPMNSLRTVLCFPILKDFATGGGDAYTDFAIGGGNAYTKQFYNLLIGSKCLRVLSLTSPRIRSLPDSIGDLKHLRHLNLSYTEIEQLPDSVCSLFNLLTLLLRSCERLEKLPDKIGHLVNLLHLDIFNTDRLQVIPSGIGMLTNLQMLSKFIVKKDCGMLKNLNNLRGILSIEGLHNVANPQDAKSANLKEKQGLEELVFKWNPHSEGNDLSVLELLEPSHQNLKSLTIDSYGGSKFPSWVSHPSFFNLVSLKLRRCEKIELLPALHNVSLLEDLEISGCVSLKYFGTSFKLFTLLKNFKIEDCENLLSLPDALMTLDDNTNPCKSHLEDLSVIRCEQLTSFPPGKLPATLKFLVIRSCRQMKSISEDMFCDNMALEYLRIVEDDKIRVFPSIDGLQSLKNLIIWDCCALESFPEVGLCNPALQRLEIDGCPRLLFLPNQMDTHLPSLRMLNVSCCPCLVSLTQEGGGLPKNLTSLIIEECENLWQPITEWGLHLLSSLEWLQVVGMCPAIAEVVLFPDDDRCLLATSLNRLIIGDFINLESLGLGLRKLSHLHNLEIRNCPKLQCLAKDALPSSLEEVSITDCQLLTEHYLKNVGEYPSSVRFFETIFFDGPCK